MLSASSLVLVIFLMLGGTSGDSVNQTEGPVTLPEGKTLILNCTYQTTYKAGEYLFWYVQYQNKEPVLLLKGFSDNQEVHNRGFQAKLVTTEKSFHLQKPSVQMSDSAVYFCAVNNNNDLRFGAGTRLTVKPNVKNPDPAVYQLRSPKSSRTSICLFTDFDSNTNVPQAVGSSAFSSKSTVLDMKYTLSKSYGALLWSDSADFGCKDNFNETFYPSSEFSCDVTSVEKGFETDINLNFQNLSVIGFRILLLKVAGFNLLMTLRLWSS